MDLEPSRTLIYWVGQVAVQFAYLEDALDEAIELAEPLMKLPPKSQTWDDFYDRHFRNRADYMRSQLLKVCEGLPASDTIDSHKEEIVRFLTKCAEASDTRNAILHSSSVEDAALGPIVRTQKRVVHPSTRRASPVKAMTTAEVQAFAIHLTTIQNGVRSLDFAINRLLRAKGVVPAR
jgi:hypothetical protein